MIAGPLRPPTSLARIGRRRRQSTAMPRNVLIRLTASAPPSAAARAIGHDVGDVGGQLGDHRHRADGADATDEPADGVGVDAQVEAVADVRARDVQLDRVEAGVAADELRHRDELVLVLARDVGDHGGPDRAEVGEVVGPEVVDAVVVEADRVEQARGRLDGARGRVARPRPCRHRLGDHAAEPLQAARTPPSRGRIRTCPRRPAPGSSARAVPACTLRSTTANHLAISPSPRERVPGGRVRGPRLRDRNGPDGPR